MLPTPSTLDHYFDISEPGDGYVEDQGLTHSQFLDTNGAALTAASVPYVAVTLNQPTITWDAATTTLNWMSLAGRFTAQFAHNARGIQVVASARKKQASGDSNPTLALKAQMYWTNPGEAQQSLTTPATATLAAASAGADVTSFAEYIVDIGARLRAESKYIKEGATFCINIGPDATLGAGLSMELQGVALRTRRHVSTSNTAKRTA